MPYRRSKKQASRYLTPSQRKGKKLNPPEPYRSWLEADVAHDLKQRKIRFKYEERKIAYGVPATSRTYTPDIELPNGVIVEIKGRWTAHDRRKMGYVIEQNPDLDIRLLFDKDNTISRNSKTRYSDWCTKRGIKFAIGQAIPQEWIDETK